MIRRQPSRRTRITGGYHLSFIYISVGSPTTTKPYPYLVLYKMSHIVTVLLLLGCFYLHVGAQITDPNEVKALQGIRKSLNDPMKYLRNWKKGDPCNSSWTGVQCFSLTQKDGYLHVRELLFLNMNLSGSLSPELGKLSYMQIMDFMWNKIRGGIPKEIGNIMSLRLLLLNGNQLTGSLPEELGYLKKLDRMQIDQNYISGSLPKSFANLERLKHLHMNNNSISGQLPPELAKLPIIVHILLDNNNLSGHLPPEFSKLRKLKILQLDNNNFEGTIPASYGDMPGLLKLSLRNCSLHGPVPDLSRVPHLGYLDLSRNQLNGSIPSNKLSDDITTIDLSYNDLSGHIPANFSGFPRLQKLSLENNTLTGSVPSNIWQGVILNGTTVLLDFQNNVLTNISDFLDSPANVSVRLQGNPVCEHANQLNIVQFCVSRNGHGDAPESSTNTEEQCLIQSCPENYEFVRNSPVRCFCAAPLIVGYRLKSPGFSKFLPYEHLFEVYVSSGLNLDVYQLYIDSFVWEAGPRLRMHLKLFPAFNNRSNTFNESEIRRMRSLLTEWTTPDSAIFGPHELLNFTLLGPYSNVNLQSSKSGISKGVLAVTVLGVIVGVVTVYTIITILIKKRNANKRGRLSRKRHSSTSLINIDGVRGFTFKELVEATDKFDESTQIGRGGYGKVYKGVLADGTVVAVKRALEGSLQGEKEFLTEIELLSRVHHRNLVSLIGYCDDGGEEMLVYEFMANGTLRDHLSVISKVALSFPMRLRIALDSAKGILYLHTEADPPIFHRDIKASNILLDSKFTAKVADFGLSKLAPVPDIEGIVPGHVSTVVKGTPGYIDPEYFLTRKLTDKSDVYSLGVVFLELLTGMQPISHGKNMVREVYLAHKAGTIFSMIDERMGSYPSECIEKFMALALSCCQEETNARPSMTDIVRELENIWFMMPEPEFGPSKSVDIYPSSEISSTSIPQTKDQFSVEMSGSDLISEQNIAISPR